MDCFCCWSLPAWCDSVVWSDAHRTPCSAAVARNSGGGRVTNNNTSGRENHANKLVLISAGGLFVTGADPLGNDAPNQEEAIPRIGEFLRGPAVVATIPLDTPRDRISVRHPGYDIRGAVRDRNVVFPIDRLTELRDEGVIGGIADETYSFIGATSQKRLLAETAPEWAEKLKAAQVDAVLLVTA